MHCVCVCMLVKQKSTLSVFVCECEQEGATERNRGKTQIWKKNGESFALF